MGAIPYSRLCVRGNHGLRYASSAGMVIDDGVIGIQPPAALILTG